MSEQLGRPDHEHSGAADQLPATPATPENVGVAAAESDNGPVVAATDNAQPTVPQPWPWVRQQITPSFEQSEPLEYHRLLRGVANYRWWRPLVAAILSMVYYITFSVLYTIPFFPYLMGQDLINLQTGEMDAGALVDTQRPLLLLLSLGSVVMMLPAVMLGMLSVGLGAGKRLWSVALRIRWRWIGRTVLPAIVALIVMNGLGILFQVLFDPSGGDLATEAPQIDVAAAMWSALIVLIIVPLQCTAEEVVFRGMFIQTLGAWLGGVRGSSGIARFMRTPVLPIVVPAIAFGFAHIYDIWGWMSVVVMALVAGWLAWRTGGLEAAISLHVVNNLVAFSFMVVGFGGSTQQTSETGGAASAIGSTIGMLLYAWWVDRDFARNDGRRTRVDWVQARPLRYEVAPQASAAAASNVASAAPEAAPVSAASSHTENQG